MAGHRPWREIKRDHAGERVHQDAVREAIYHSRVEAGAHNTSSLEIARQISPDANRPLTKAEKKARAGFGWLIRQEDGDV